VREGRRCALLVAGAGWLEPELRRVVAKHAIPDVFFVGFLQLTEIMRAYACADVFTLFSGLNETWGLVVNEAMNFSLPIVVSDKVGCGRDLVSSGRNGWVVSTEDTDTLAARFDSLLASSELRQRFGKESLAIIDEWSPEKTAEGIASAALYAAGGSSDTQCTSHRL
jgi:glycosyltransferase involved in cell wall biosynthesis